MEVKKDEASVYLRWLKEEGIKEFLPEERSLGVKPAQPLTFGSSASLPAAEKQEIESDAWMVLRSKVAACTLCQELAESRTQTVFGSGSMRAQLMFVGEAPGHDEDLQGLPFVGEAGRLLTKIIQAIQLERDQVYIANVLKCRPPRNRAPKPEEVSCCRPFLEKQIELIRPRIICALGAHAAHAVLQTDQAISKLRGQFREYPGNAISGLQIKVMCTFHPAYLLRNPAEKRKVWDDMKAIRQVLDSF